VTKKKQTKTVPPKKIDVESIWDSAIENGINGVTKAQLKEIQELQKDYYFWCKATRTCLYCGTGKNVITLGTNACHKCLFAHRWEKPGATLEPNDNWAMFIVCSMIAKKGLWKIMWRKFKNG